REGGTYVAPTQLCYFQAYGNEVVANSFKDNGGYGNPTNGDIAMVTTPHNPGNCFHDNSDSAGLSSDPPAIQSPPYNPCGLPNGNPDPVLTAEVLCATQLLAPCPTLPAATYPRPSNVVLDRKSTRLNSSHVEISYAVFCLKKKKKTKQQNL